MKIGKAPGILKPNQETTANFHYDLKQEAIKINLKVNNSESI